MAIPKVNLRTIKRRGSTVYMLDYTVGRKRFREAVGSSKRDAELLRANLQSDLTRGRFDLKAAKPNTISLDGLVKEFLFTKQNVVRKTSQKRFLPLLGLIGASVPSELVATGFLAGL